MDFLVSREDLSGSDFECSRSNSEWNPEKLSILAKNEGKKTWGVIWSSLSSFGVSAKQELKISPPKFSGEIVDEKVELLIIKKLGDECGDDPPEKNNAKKKSNPSFNNSTTALLITSLFLIVMLFQGISSRSNASPGPERGSKGFFSVQYFNKISPFGSNAPISASTNRADFGLFSRGRSTHLLDDTRNA